MKKEYCEFCQGIVEAHNIEKHFSGDHGRCINLDTKIKAQKFPIFCKNENSFYKILGPSAVQVVDRYKTGIAIQVLEYSDSITTTALDQYYQGRFEESSEQEFGKARIEAQNDMTRIVGKYKLATTTAK